ncbi:MAG: T9SS type A sorting domain-containing protein [Bacteroidales bacterium]|nr:T9SS type A sorting domain-containing protein [Bacteroidales bacterium]
MKRVFLMIMGVFSFMALANAQIPGENFDVTHYEINLWDFNFTSHTLQGEAFVDITVTEPTNTFVLELKSLTVTDAATDSYGVTSFSQEGDLLTIVIDEDANAGETLTLDIRYGGNTFSETWGGVEWWGNDYVYTLGVGFDSQPHNLGKTWFPCVDNFTDKATYSLVITVTNDKKAICGGNHVNTLDNGDGTSNWYWEIPQDVATYHPSFAIGDYVVWEDVYHGIERDIPVEVYVKPAQINSVPGTFVHVKDIAAFYEENFGPYPFNRIGYVCTGKGCMEHIDNIAITPGVITGNTTQEEYVAHELSHMYFGNMVTCSTAGDMWLNEGFAQFCGLFYRVGVYGEDDFQENMSTLINKITNWCKSESHWIPLNNMPLDMTYDSDAIYDRGAVIVNTMMNYMGRENFLTGIRHYLETYSYGASSSEQLRDALTEATGIDMNGFFDNYVFIGGMPHYSVDIAEVTPNGNQYDTHIKTSYWHVGPSHLGMNNRVEVTFVGADCQLQTQMVCWDGMEDDQVVTLDFEPIAAFVDYYNRFLDAKTDGNLTATAPASLTQGKFKASVNSVTDSVMLHLEDHCIGPDNDPEIPYLTLSTCHYWNFFRNDIGEATVNAQISFTNSGQDGDIIQTENDSAVLLYRSDINDTWHTIPYTQEGNWKIGRFNVTDVQTGQYTIGVIDKMIWSVNKQSTQLLNIYPIPSQGFLTVETEPADYQITNLSGQTVMTGRVESKRVDISRLSSGTYFIIINGITKKFIVQ